MEVGTASVVMPSLAAFMELMTGLEPSALQFHPFRHLNIIMWKWRNGRNYAACDLVRLVRGHRLKSGADDRARTGDLVLTKDVLYLLSYISKVGADGETRTPTGDDYPTRS
jgi:hypothetical protein